MGAGQIGGLATLLDIDFSNAAGFIGNKAKDTEGQFLVYFLSQAMMFCVGTLIEAHVVLTPASCVFGEKHKFNVFGGTHRFLENVGVPRLIDHICTHKGYNHSQRWTHCAADNIALLVFDKEYSFHSKEDGMDYVVNRIRYLSSANNVKTRVGDKSCRYYGWGSRRNGFLIPLLIYARRAEVLILPQDKCPAMWRKDDKYLCIRQPLCKSEKYGALCPDDLGSILVCSGFAEGMMTSRLIDRPCGVGFLDLANYNKFLTCGVDDARDVIGAFASEAFDYSTPKPPAVKILITPPPLNNTPKDIETIKTVVKEEVQSEAEA